MRRATRPERLSRLMWLLLWSTPLHCEAKMSLFLSGKRPQAVRCHIKR
jgi:hypothetical protein